MLMETDKWIIDLLVFFKKNNAYIFCWSVRYNFFWANNSKFGCKVEKGLQTPVLLLY